MRLYGFSSNGTDENLYKYFVMRNYNFVTPVEILLGLIYFVMLSYNIYVLACSIEFSLALWAYLRIKFFFEFSLISAPYERLTIILKKDQINLEKNMKF